MPSQDALRDALKEMRALVTAAVHLGRWQGGNGIHAAILKADAALDAPEPEPTTSDAEFLCDMANLMELSWRPEFKDVHVGGSQATIKRLREIADRLEPCTVPEPVQLREALEAARYSIDNWDTQPLDEYEETCEKIDAALAATAPEKGAKRAK